MDNRTRYKWTRLDSLDKVGDMWDKISHKDVLQGGAVRGVQIVKIVDFYFCAKMIFLLKNHSVIFSRKIFKNIIFKQVLFC